MSSALKEKWAKLPDYCFSILTFGELSVGNKFIFLPEPSGFEDTGLRTVHFLFVKTEQRLSERGDNSHGRAVRIDDGKTCDFLDSTPVIHIQ